jgi:hypothetical protein
MLTGNFSPFSANVLLSGYKTGHSSGEARQRPFGVALVMREIGFSVEEQARVDLDTEVLRTSISAIELAKDRHIEEEPVADRLSSDGKVYVSTGDGCCLVPFDVAENRIAH